MEYYYRIALIPLNPISRSSKGGIQHITNRTSCKSPMKLEHYVTAMKGTAIPIWSYSGERYMYTYPIKEVFEIPNSWINLTVSMA